MDKKLTIIANLNILEELVDKLLTEEDKHMGLLSIIDIIRIITPDGAVEEFRRTGHAKEAYK